MKIESTRRLRLREILILRVSEADPEQEARLTEFAEMLNGVVRIPVIILTDDMTLESISDAQMRKAGWVRKRDADAVSRH